MCGAYQGGTEGARRSPDADPPPAFSALKQGGVPAYKRAREGKKVELAPRPIEIHRMQLVAFKTPDEITFEVLCSKGTYVRVLGEAVAAALGTCGHLGALRRIQTLGFDVDDAVELARLETALGEPLDGAAPGALGLADAVAHLPKVVVDAETETLIRHGKRLSWDMFPRVDAASVAPPEGLVRLILVGRLRAYPLLPWAVRGSLLPSCGANRTERRPPSDALKRLPY